MPKKNKSVIPAVVIGLAATVAGFSVALRSLHNISLVEKFKDKLTCSGKSFPWEDFTDVARKGDGSWDNPVPHDLVNAGGGNKRIIHLDPMNGMDSLDSLPGYKVINLKDGNSAPINPFSFTGDIAETADETIAFLDTVSGDELNGEELPSKEKKLGKRSAEGYPAAYEVEEVSDYLEQEFGITSPTINPKGDISAAIQAHDNIEHLIEAARNVKVNSHIVYQHPDQLAGILDNPATEPKKKKKPTKTTELTWKDFAEFKDKYGSLIQDAFDASKEDKGFVLKVYGKTHGIGARGTVGRTKAGKEFKSFDAKDIAAIHKKVNS